MLECNREKLFSFFYTVAVKKTVNIPGRQSKIFGHFLKTMHDRAKCRSSQPEVFLGKGVLKICSKCTREHP